jgi:D-lactate dehydrogenase
MRRYKIAIFDAKPHDIEFFNSANDKRFEIEFFNVRLSQKTCYLAQGFDAICVFVNDAVTAEIIDELVRLGVKLIALRSTGYNHVDLQAAFKKISVVRVPEYSPYSVAEFTIGMMLSLNRKIHLAHARVHEKNFSINGLLGFDMHGKTVGVIGAGHIGKVVIQILKGFGMNVLAYDIDQSQVQQANCTYAELDLLYRQSDIVTLHCPLTPKNTHMINKIAIEKMKHGVMLINTGRGKLIETTALIQALETGKIGAAGLDVYENEADYFYKDLSSSILEDKMLARLLTFSNVLLTPHQAFFTKEALEDIATTTLANVQDFFDGKDLKNEVRFK